MKKVIKDLEPFIVTLVWLVVFGLGLGLIRLHIRNIGGEELLNFIFKTFQSQPGKTIYQYFVFAFVMFGIIVSYLTYVIQSQLRKTVRKSGASTKEIKAC